MVTGRQTQKKDIAAQVLAGKMLAISMRDTPDATYASVGSNATQKSYGPLPNADGEISAV